MKNFLLILFSIVFGVVGQLSLKHGVGLVSGQSSQRIIHSLDPRSMMAFLSIAILNRFVILGFILYLISAASWLIILSRMDLSLAYPMISIGYILVVVLSKYIFDEPVTPMRIVGTLFVCFGVFLLLRS